MIRPSFAAALFGLAAPAEQATGEKVILDTDFKTLGDDGQVLIMATRLS